MQVLRKAFEVLGFKQPEPEGPKKPDYPQLMRGALERIRMAELQIQEAVTLEDLDVGRSELLAAQAEVQQLVRGAKRERGIAVRPIAQNEEEYHKLVDFMNNRGGPDRQPRRKTGTARQ